MRTFIIHDDNCVDRKDMVYKLIEKTGASIFPAVLLPNGREGCHTSHYILYKQVDEIDDILIFEDDCEIVSELFLEPLQFKDNYDLIYIGINNFRPDGSWGTHAMWISPYAKKCFFEYNADLTRAVDHVWNEVEQKYKLRVWRPPKVDTYVRQKAGLKSIITGKIR